MSKMEKVFFLVVENEELVSNARKPRKNRFVPIWKNTFSEIRIDRGFGTVLATRGLHSSGFIEGISKTLNVYKALSGFKTPATETDLNKFPLPWLRFLLVVS